KGLPVLLGDEAGASELAAVWPSAAAALAASFWPGALTIVVQARAEVPSQVRLGDTVALRVPGLPALLTIIQKSGRPLIGTSANRSGEPPALTAQDALAALGDSVRLVLDGGRTAGEPSTVVRVEKNSVRVLRAGAISEETLRAVLAH
ncbi:MAG TPA: L-threonylcarbamoyladenylate synthase, partial [Chloroflexota bacterium]|nr:L-threonylcarbamoyladenylate synthase [Chloroflexota bacterium]